MSNRRIPLGERQRLRILALITEPLSASDIASVIHLSTAGVLKHTKAMRNETPRRCYIAAYDINGVGRPTPLYAAGSKPDVEYDHMTVENSHHQNLLSRLVVKLESGPKSVKDLAKLMHLSHSGIHNLVTELRAMGWSHIGDWTPLVNRNRSPMHVLGFGKDKPMPVKTRAQRWKEEKANVDVHEVTLARRRARISVQKAVAKPRGIFAALGI